MPIVRNLAQVVEYSATLAGKRTLILVDHVLKVSYYTHFVGDYDRPTDHATVAQLFDSSLQQIKMSQNNDTGGSTGNSTGAPNENALSIFNEIGRWKVTLVSKAKDGSITVSDATNSPVDKYLGVGG